MENDKAIPEAKERRKACPERRLCKKLGLSAMDLTDTYRNPVANTAQIPILRWKDNLSFQIA